MGKAGRDDIAEITERIMRGLLCVCTGPVVCIRSMREVFTFAILLFALAQGPVALGHRRLAIIDLSPMGHQPMFDRQTGDAIIYNGELYNYLDLRAELAAKGHSFRTASDTEVVLRAYETWGLDCLRRFNGMFAFAIRDARTGRLVLARDRVGEKPLYYYRDAERFVFALIPPVILIFLVLGTIFLGIATPTEGGAMGAIGALILALIRKRLNWSLLNQALENTAKLAIFVMFILIGSTVFSFTFSAADGHLWVEHLFDAIPGGELGFVIAVSAIIFVLGMFLDGISIFLIFVPLFMPIAYNFGWHPVWFGVLLTLNVALGQFTPPVAVNLMVACRIAGVPMESTLRWVGWLLLGMGSIMLLVIAEPEIALWLPRYLGFN